MALTDSKSRHILNLMEKLNQQREDDQLCDLIIIIGEMKIPAHKCVLVCESEYFKSLTLGPLRQDVAEVDLTPVTDDTETVKSVINYIYTGDIDIQDDNLRCILSLASYLLISSLRQKCIDYMQNQRNMETSVQYYLIANEFMVPELEEDLAYTVRTRFHDCLILQKDTVKISPTQLKHLINNCDIFVHCSGIDILSFVSDWVRLGQTEEHESLGCEILDITFQGEDSFAMRNNNTNNIETMNALNEKLGEANDTDFIKKAKMLIGDCLTQQHQNEENCVTLPAAAKGLVAFVSKRSSPDIANTKLIHALYSYLPEERTWYSLRNYKDCARQVNVADCCGSFLVSDRIYFIMPDEIFLNIFDLRKMKWSSVSCKQLVEGVANFNAQTDVKYVRSGHETLYLILRITVVMGSENILVYFRCYQLTSQNTWKFLFRAPLLTAGYVGTQIAHRQGSVFAVFTGDCTTMLIAYRADVLHVFAVDMDSIGTPQVLMQQKTAPSTNCSFGTVILQRKNRLFFVECFQNEKGERCMICRYAYNWKLKKIVKVAKTEITLRPLAPRSLCDADKTYDFYSCANDSEHVWYYEGNRLGGSSLRSVSFDESGRLAEIVHTPPPFSGKSILVAGSIKQDLLNSPVTEYLSV